MAEITENIENPNFRLKAVAELLDGEHHFYIPSYQRGYRWDDRQVEDLLKDIWDFARNDEKKKTDFYCLQPIVVKIDKQNNNWTVIDGQQRLTTLLLLINYLKNGSRTPFVVKSEAYTIEYQTRDIMDFINPVKTADIDSFHVFEAKRIIEKWFDDRIDEIDYSAFEKVLFNKSEDVAQVKVIWYVTESDEDIESIKIFNNLNKGKIRLTNAELIKALFVLKAREKKDGNKTEELILNEFAFEWNEIENKLQDNRFWYFLTNKNYNPATRIDLVFDFLTEKTEKHDADFSYRKFQNLYDKTTDDLWGKLEINNFSAAWKKVKEVYHTFQYWYENSEIYHYVGYLVYNGIDLPTIYNTCKGKNKPETLKALQELIGNRILKYGIKEIDTFSYSENIKECKQVLLFFNIETCVRQQQNQNEQVNNQEFYTYYRFPFDLLKMYDWDVEHVGSQTENPLKEIKDKIVWLSFIPLIETQHTEWARIKEDANNLIKELKEFGRDRNDKFSGLYSEIISIFQKDVNESKDTLDNLVLLDSGTNRGYGNALFASKRQVIIEKDMNGVFIPNCTKNLFLKYFSKNDDGSTQWKNSWEKPDRKAYLKAIHENIDYILKNDKDE